MSSPSLGLHLKDPNNLFELQNTITNNMNVFERTRERYLQCNSNEYNREIVPACELKDEEFSNVQNAYNILLQSIEKLDKAMNENMQKNPDAISKVQYSENINKIKDQYSKIVEKQKAMDNSLKFIREHQHPNNSLMLALKSSTYIYIISVIAVICLLYYIIVG